MSVTQLETVIAAAQFLKILERVKLGERVLLTESGKPVGMLVPSDSKPQPDLTEIVEGLLSWRKASGPTLGPGLTIRQMIEDGRRF